MWIPRRNLVIPAKAGIQGNRHGTRRPWTPAFAGVTAFASSRSSQHAAGDETGEQQDDEQVRHERDLLFRIAVLARRVSGLSPPLSAWS